MTIKEVVEITGLSQDTLRFYEKKGLVGPINKTSSGIRNYSDEDISRIKFVKCMRSASLSIDILKEYIDLYDEGNNTKEQQKELLTKQKDILENKINDMKKAYDLLCHKLDLFYNKEGDNK